MRITWPGASGDSTGAGTGAGGSACADGASNATANAEIDEMVQTTRTFAPKRPFRRKVSEFRGEQLSDLNGVQRRTFSQVVAGHEQGKATTVWHAGILADAADQ